MVGGRSRDGIPTGRQDEPGPTPSLIADCEADFEPDAVRRAHCVVQSSIITPVKTRSSDDGLLSLLSNATGSAGLPAR